nr:MAG TPA: hypothetical protein [Inoviridae sp.]
MTFAIFCFFLKSEYNYSVFIFFIINCLKHSCFHSLVKFQLNQVGFCKYSSHRLSLIL